jgi:hypothetical protein
MRAKRHDAFISYNSADSSQVHSLAQVLRDQENISCWLDVWSIIPGTPWQEALESALARSSVIIVAVGRAGLGPWHYEELRSALELRVERAGEQRRVITVLLPGATQKIVDELPRFLRRLAWVDLRDGLVSPAFARLVSGIRGEQPGYQDTNRVEPHRTVRLTAREINVIKTVKSATESIRKWARSTQNDDGGFPSDSAGSYSCTWSTAGLLWALQNAGEEPHETWMKRALTWVLDNRNDDGGTPQVVRGDPSLTDATAQTLLACAGAAASFGDRQSSPSIDSLTDWLLTRQQGSGGWNWRPGPEKAWTAPTVFALLALRSVDTGRSDVSEAIGGGASWLQEARNQDLGWGSQYRTPSRPPLSGLAVFCLAELGLTEVATESAHYLRATQSRTGHWVSGIDRPHGLSIIRFGDAYGVLGLASCTALKESTELRRGITALLGSFQGNHFQYEGTPLHTWPTRDGLLGLAAVINSVDGHVDTH